MDATVKAVHTTASSWAAHISAGQAGAPRFLHTAGNSLGLSMHQLKSQLRAGESLADIAAGQQAKAAEEPNGGAKMYLDDLRAALSTVVPAAKQADASSVIQALLNSPIHLGKPSAPSGESAPTPVPSDIGTGPAATPTVSTIDLLVD